MPKMHYISKKNALNSDHEDEGCQCLKIDDTNCFFSTNTSIQEQRKNKRLKIKTESH